MFKEDVQNFFSVARVSFDLQFVGSPHRCNLQKNFRRNSWALRSYGRLFCTMHYGEQSASSYGNQCLHCASGTIAAMQPIADLSLLSMQKKLKNFIKIVHVIKANANILNI